MYHSSATLLPDGSIMSSGSNPNADYVPAGTPGYKYFTEYRCVYVLLIYEDAHTDQLFFETVSSDFTQIIILNLDQLQVLYLQLLITVEIISTFIYLLEMLDRLQI